MPLTPESLSRAAGAGAPAPGPSNGAPTPLMRQYHGLKNRHPDALLFFRLGDFYELFFDDAKTAAPVLEVALTQRQGVPMCGVPYHAASGYLAKLLKAGLRVAIAEQMEDPAKTKGMVSRDVVRVISPGTVLEEELLDGKQNNFLAAVAGTDGASASDSPSWALAALDLSTGELLVTSRERDPGRQTLTAELARLAPREILATGDFAVPGPVSVVTRVPETLFEEAVGRDMVKGLFPPDASGGVLSWLRGPAAGAVGALLAYCRTNHSAALGAVRPPRLYGFQDFLAMDENALRRLDILPAEGSRPDPAPRSLWDVLDHTATAAGARKLRWWLLHPLMSLDAIRERQDRVAFFVERRPERLEQAKILRDTADVERVLGRLAAGSATGRDLTALRRTLRRLPDLRTLLSRAPFLPGDVHPSMSLVECLVAPRELTDLLETALAEEPPFRLSEGGVIRDGYSAALDDLRGLARQGRDWISRMEEAERRRTGISSLKVGYTSVFGYYLEVSRAAVGKVPGDWIRKQTLANAERYVTPDLKTQEDRILGAEEKARALEVELFAGVRSAVLARQEELRRLADAISELDALASLAEAADRGRFVRPRVTEDPVLRLEKARHPVVEAALAAGGGKTAFVPNDLSMDGRENQILIVTGPNMAGKSTYLRQAAILVVLAQMGSFVPAEDAEVGLVDRIFTRIGAGDNLAAGASTFMVEMQEVARILAAATPRSLVIMDEVGRGTSTFDGVAVAWAVVETLHRPEGGTGPKVLFATHYFELTDLADRLGGVKNFHAAVKEWHRPGGQADLAFLHQILPGAADRSYGVHVAQMAGLPPACVARARDILRALEETGPGADSGASGGSAGRKVPAADPGDAGPSGQLGLFGRHPVIDELDRLNPDSMTPLDALLALHRFKNSLRGDDA